jgi:hypothetical protein
MESLRDDIVDTIICGRLRHPDRLGVGFHPFDHFAHQFAQFHVEQLGTLGNDVTINSDGD